MNYQNHTVVVLHGNVPTRKIAVERTHNGMNCASLENRIDAGKITTPQKIPREVSTLIINARVASPTAKTQALLAVKCNYPLNDIKEMENGTMDLTHANKLKIRKVQQVLGIPKFNL
jgi:hypothetical protein